MSSKIRKPNPRERRNALWLLAVAAVLGIVAVLVFVDSRQAIEDWIARQLDQPGGIGGMLLAVTVLAILPVVAAGIYLFVLGSRSVTAQRFPPPGFSAVRDVQVYEGLAARRRARVVQALAVILVLTALLLPTMIWWFARSLEAMA